MSLTEQEVVRYSRHIILPEVGGRGQRKVKGSSVLLVGLGASGSAAALYLAAAGIGGFTLWDPGLVSSTGLAGGIGHDTTRIGQSRAHSAAHPMRAINPAARVEVLDHESDLLMAVPEHQLVLASGGDWGGLADAALGSGSALILFGARGAAGAVAAFRSGEACPNCLGDLRAGELGLAPEGAAPAIAAAAGVVGVVAATEAVKLILGIGTPLFGRVLTYDGWTSRFGEHTFNKMAGCARCGE